MRGVWVTGLVLATLATEARAACSDNQLLCNNTWPDACVHDVGGCCTQYPNAQQCGSKSYCCPTNGTCSGGHPLSLSSDPCTLTLSCNTGYGNCDGDLENGCEVNFATSTKDCPAFCCARQGVASSHCVSGACVISCTATSGDCDHDVSNGCETDLTSTHRHCGTCDTDCTNDTTMIGYCQDSLCGATPCPAGKLNCDHNPDNDCEVDAQNDDNNCGACGNVCSALHVVGTTDCVSGKCTYTGTCADGYADCDGDKANGCEVAIKVDANHCGTCETKCTAPMFGTAVCSDGTCDFTCPDKRCGDVCAACCGDSDCPIDVGDKCKDPKCDKPGSVDATCGFNEKVCTQLECYSQVNCLPATGECKSQPVTGGECGASGCCDPPGSTGTCNAGVCSCTPKDCSSLDEPCKTGLCAADSGACVAENKPNGLSCTPADKCVLDATCSAGDCVGTPKSCPAPAPCKVASCEPSTGDCSFVTDATVGAICTTSNVCVQNEACDATGHCIGTTLPDSTPCALAGCTGDATCQGGACVCPTPVDMTVPDLSLAIPTDDLGPVPDLTTTQGRDKSGCSVATPAADLALLVVVAWLLLRRLRRSAPST